HDEFRRFGFAGVPPNNMDIIRAFVEGLTGCEGYLLAASHLHHDRALQHIDNAWALWRWIGSELPGGYSTVIIRPSLPGRFDRSFDNSCVTLASCAASIPHMSHARTKTNFVKLMETSVFADTYASYASAADRATLLVRSVPRVLLARSRNESRKVLRYCWEAGFSR